MTFYQALTGIVLTVLPFFPVQIDARIPYIIGFFALLLLPIFLKNVKDDLASKNPTTIFFVLFLLASSLSTIISIDQKRSIVQLMLYASYFIIFISIRSVFPTLRSKELLMLLFLLITSCLSLISLYHTLILKYVNRAQEGVSFMWIYYGHNHLANLLVFAIPISLYFLKKYWKTNRLNVLLLVTCCLLLVTLLFTMARSAMFALLLATLIAFALSFKLYRSQVKGLLLVSVLFSCIILLFGVFATNDRFVTRKFRLKFDTREPRVVYWQQAINNFKVHPFFGTGLDTFRIVNTREPMPKGVIGSYYAHNFFLQMLSDAGIFGFLSSVGLIASVLWQSGKKLLAGSQKLVARSKQLLYLFLFIGMLSSTFMAMLDMGWQLPVVFLFFWIFARFLATNHESQS